MKRIALFFAVISMAVAGVFAKGPEGDKSDRTQWAKEMRQLRTNYVVKKLGLEGDSRDKFIAAYSSMQVDLDKLHRESRQLYKAVEKKGDAASNAELEKAANAMYEMHSKEGAIEMRYYSKFKSILSPRQLFKLKDAEHKFSRELMKQRKGTKK